MKSNILKISLALFASAVFTSCNKDYNCVCSLNGTQTSSESVRAKTKNEAEDKCNERKTTLGVTYQCEIK